MDCAAVVWFPLHPWPLPAFGGRFRRGRLNRPGGMTAERKQKGNTKKAKGKHM